MPAMTKKELQPKGRWERFMPRHCDGPGVMSHSGWRRGKIVVISSLTMAEAPDGRGDVIPQYHLSVSRRGRRPLPKDIKAVLRSFGMRHQAPEEDNHHPGVARHFWLPLDPARRVDCECKSEEVTVVDPDGYTWTNPTDPSDCRGCELARLTAKPCPIHAPDRVESSDAQC